MKTTLLSLLVLGLFAGLSAKVEQQPSEQSAELTKIQVFKDFDKATKHANATGKSVLVYVFDST